MSLELEYPCQWEYKIIGSDQQQLRDVVSGTLNSMKYSIIHSHNSSGEKFCCLTVEVIVDSDQRRNSIYNALKNHPAVAMVL